MIAGIGVDLVSMERIARLSSRWGARFERRILAPSELDELPAAPAARERRLAMSFAAKEAFGKALGTGISWPASLGQIAVRRNERGAPSIEVGPRLAKLLAERGIGPALVSLSDEAGFAIAVVALERQE